MKLPTASRPGSTSVRLAICCALALALGASRAPAQTLTSDAPDYPPGATATLTGAGFAAGETVQMQVTHVNSPSSGSGHDPWFVVADANGGFVTTWLVCGDDCIGELLRATADGLTSLGHAECFFTDAPPSADLDQARNGPQGSPVSPVDMQNGNLGSSQSHYVESQSVPYRAVLTSMPIGESITITLEYDIKHSGRHALDYLTHYDRLQPHTYAGHTTQETVDPLEGLTGFPTTFTTYAIPAPSSTGSPVSGQPTTSFNALPSAERVMTLYGGTLTGIAYASEGSLTASQSSTSIDVTFTTSSDKLVLAWGGHIGARADWGFDGGGNPRSAGGISGSPYHMRLIGWVNNTAPPDLSNLGNQDRSLAADAVVPPPTCDITGSLSVCCGTTNVYTAITDATSPTYAWSLSANTSGAFIVGSSTGSSVTVNSGTGGSYTISVAITANGFTTTCFEVVSVTPGNPVISALPGPSTIECPATPVFTTPTVTDVCDPSPSLTFSDVTTPGACAGAYSVTRTWTATDVCGYSSQASQTITVVDTTPPSISAAGADATIDCPAVPVFTPPTATDLCDASPVIVEVSDDTLAGACAGAYVRTKTWKAVDACGNESGTVSQTITVQDVTAPVIGAPGDDEIIECPATPVFTPPTATDNCDATVTVVELSDDTTPATCFGTYSRTKTWNATDACGNVSATVSQTVTVVDTTPPVIVPPPNQTLYGNGNCCATVTGLQGDGYASDTCGGAVSFVSDIPEGTCLPVGDNDVTWTATDPCGNQSSHTQTITVMGRICAAKFYDADADGTWDYTDTNLNGQWDPGEAGEQGIAGWQIVVSGATSVAGTTGLDGRVCLDVFAGANTVSEADPNEPVWVATTPTAVVVTIDSTSCEQYLEFGNYCFKPPTGGRTLGFWSNRNGQKILQQNDPAWRNLVNSLNLRKADGSAFTVSTGSTFLTAYTQLKNFLLGANATNMANMLSAQLVATTLSVTYNGLGDATVVVVPGGVTTGAGVCVVPFLSTAQPITCGSPALLAPTSVAGSTSCGCTSNDALVTIADVRARAVCLLGAYGLTTSASTERTYEECVKNILDMINNNGNNGYPCGGITQFLNPDASRCSATFP